MESIFGGYVFWNFPMLKLNFMTRKCFIFFFTIVGYFSLLILTSFRQLLSVLNLLFNRGYMFQISTKVFQISTKRLQILIKTFDITTNCLRFRHKCLILQPKYLRLRLKSLRFRPKRVKFQPKVWRFRPKKLDFEKKVELSTQKD